MPSRVRIHAGGTSAVAKEAHWTKLRSCGTHTCCVCSRALLRTRLHTRQVLLLCIAPRCLDMRADDTVRFMEEGKRNFGTGMGWEAGSHPTFRGPLRENRAGRISVLRRWACCAGRDSCCGNPVGCTPLQDMGGVVR